MERRRERRRETTSSSSERGSITEERERVRYKGEIKHLKPSPSRTPLENAILERNEVDKQINNLNDRMGKVFTGQEYNQLALIRPGLDRAWQKAQEKVDRAASAEYNADIQADKEARIALRSSLIQRVQLEKQSEDIARMLENKPSSTTYKAMQRANERSLSKAKDKVDRATQKLHKSFTAHLTKYTDTFESEFDQEIMIESRDLVQRCTDMMRQDYQGIDEHGKPMAMGLSDIGTFWMAKNQSIAKQITDQLAEVASKSHQLEGNLKIKKDEGKLTESEYLEKSFQNRVTNLVEREVIKEKFRAKVSAQEEEFRRLPLHELFVPDQNGQRQGYQPSSYLRQTNDQFFPEADGEYGQYENQ